MNGLARHRGHLGDVGNPNRRGPIEHRAVSVQRRPVHRLIACAAGPGGVAAAVTEASLMADERPARAEGVAVRASRRRRVDDPVRDDPVLLPKYAALGIYDRAAGASLNNVACKALVARRRSGGAGCCPRCKVPASQGIVASVGAIGAGVTIVTRGTRRAEHRKHGLINQRTRKNRCRNCNRKYCGVNETAHN